jgi:hypothetical protein
LVYSTLWMWLSFKVTTIWKISMKLQCGENPQIMLVVIRH